jgi:hypothetical protein
VSQIHISGKMTSRCYHTGPEHGVVGPCSEVQSWTQINDKLVCELFGIETVPKPKPPPLRVEVMLEGKQQEQQVFQKLFDKVYARLLRPEFAELEED